MSLQDLQKATQGQILVTSQTQFNGVGTDTRKDLSQKIFFALRGDQFDAHDYLAQAVQKKAGVLVIDRKPEGLDSLLKTVSVILVPDTLRALQDFAHWWRVKQPARILGLTGSNGKTTTKQFLTTLLSEKYKTWANVGSFNNHWGVPLTLLEIEPDTEVAVVEMGMNHAGELTRLCEIAEPDIVTVTMVGRGHIEHFGSEEAIARAKAEIYQAAKPESIRVFNIDNPHTRKMWEGALKQFPAKQILTFSNQDPSADVLLKLIEGEMDLLVKGHIGKHAGEVRVPVFGQHNVLNLAAAMAMAFAAGVSPEQIWSALPRCSTGWGRNQWLHLTSGARILFDGYNANPDSMRAALQSVKAIRTTGRKFAVLGDMLELGEQSAQLHQELGAQAAQVGFESLVFVGQFGAAFAAGLKAAGYKKSLVIADTYQQRLATEVGSMLNPQDIVIVKASRGVRLEQIVIALKPVDFQNK